MVTRSALPCRFSFTICMSPSTGDVYTVYTPARGAPYQLMLNIRQVHSMVRESEGMRVACSTHATTERSPDPALTPPAPLPRAVLNTERSEGSTREREVAGGGQSRVRTPLGEHPLALSLLSVH